MMVLKDDLCSGGSAYNAAGCWLPLRFPYEQDIMRSQVRNCLSWCIVVIDTFLKDKGDFRHNHRFSRIDGSITGPQGLSPSIMLALYLHE